MTTAAAGVLSLERRRTVLAVIDVQERLAAAMPAAALADAIRNLTILIEAARRFAIPVVLSEQYPRGLGKTVAPIAEAVAAHPMVLRVEKLEFGLCAAAGFAAIEEAVGDRDQFIVTGMEAHVCVFQTVRQLASRGKQVQVPEDAVLSRTPANWRVGLGLMARAGAVLTSTETVVFDLLGTASGDDFKALSRLIR